MEKPSAYMDYSAQLPYPGNVTKKSQGKRFTNKRIKKDINNFEKTHQTNYSKIEILAISLSSDYLIIALLCYVQIVSQG